MLHQKFSFWSQSEGHALMLTPRTKVRNVLGHRRTTEETRVFGFRRCRGDPFGLWFTCSVAPSVTASGMTHCLRLGLEFSLALANVTSCLSTLKILCSAMILTEKQLSLVSSIDIFIIKLSM